MVYRDLVNKIIETLELPPAPFTDDNYDAMKVHWAELSSKAQLKATSQFVTRLPQGKKQVEDLFKTGTAIVNGRWVKDWQAYDREMVLYERAKDDAKVTYDTMMEEYNKEVNDRRLLKDAQRKVGVKALAVATSLFREKRVRMAPPPPPPKRSRPLTTSGLLPEVTAGAMEKVMATGATTTDQKYQDMINKRQEHVWRANAESLALPALLAQSIDANTGAIEAMVERIGKIDVQLAAIATGYKNFFYSDGTKVLPRGDAEALNKERQKLVDALDSFQHSYDGGYPDADAVLSRYQLDSMDALSKILSFKGKFADAKARLLAIVQRSQEAITKSVTEASEMTVNAAIYQPNGYKEVLDAYNKNYDDALKTIKSSSFRVDAKVYAAAQNFSRLVGQRDRKLAACEAVHSDYQNAAPDLQSLEAFLTSWRANRDQLRLQWYALLPTLPTSERGAIAEVNAEIDGIQDRTAAEYYSEAERTVNADMESRWKELVTKAKGAAGGMVVVYQRFFQECDAMFKAQSSLVSMLKEHAALYRAVGAAKNDLTTKAPLADYFQWLFKFLAKVSDYYRGRRRTILLSKVVKGIEDSTLKTFSDTLVREIERRTDAFLTESEKTFTYQPSVIAWKAQEDLGKLQGGFFAEVLGPLRSATGAKWWVAMTTGLQAHVVAVSDGAKALVSGDSSKTAGFQRPNYAALPSLYDTILFEGLRDSGLLQKLYEQGPDADEETIVPSGTSLAFGKAPGVVLTLRAADDYDCLTLATQGSLTNKCYRFVSGEYFPLTYDPGANAVTVPTPNEKEKIFGDGNQYVEALVTEDTKVFVQGKRLQYAVDYDALPAPYDQKATT
jgi:hypothetical protein